MKIRNRIALLIVALFVLGTGSIAAYQSKPKAVTVTDNGKVTQYETTEVLVGEFLASENITIAEKDIVSVAKDSKVEDDMEIEITRWNPQITLKYNEETIHVGTRSYTVSQFIKEQGITLGEKYTVSPEGDTPLEDGLEIVIKTQKTDTEVRRAELPFETEIQTTSELKPGERKVKQEGKKGLVEREFKVVKFGGEIVEETQIKSNILVEPVKEIVLEGVKNVIKCPDTGKTYEYTKAMNMEATAYTDIPNDRWYGITASGMPTFVGMVAVDKNVIPLGTKLYVEGYGIAHAGDTGGAVKGNIIDLYMTNSKQTRAFGRRPKKVYILKDQSIDVRAERR